MVNIIAKKKPIISEKWFNMIISSYPETTSTFLRKQINPFSNPVGNTIREMITMVLDALCDEDVNEKVYESIDKFVRIRAVQDFTPSTALNFIFMLKQVVKKELKDELNNKDMYEAFYLFNSKIDELMLRAFESYMKYREKIYELKVHEFKNMAFRLLEKANLTFENQGEEFGYEKNISDTDHVK